MEIHQLILLGEIHEMSTTSNICPNFYTCLVDLVVKRNSSYLWVTGSNSLHMAMGLYLKLCPTIAPPSPSTCIK